MGECSTVVETCLNSIRGKKGRRGRRKTEEGEKKNGQYYVRETWRRKDKETEEGEEEEDKEHR